MTESTEQLSLQNEEAQQRDALALERLHNGILAIQKEQDDEFEIKMLISDLLDQIEVNEKEEAKPPHSAPPPEIPEPEPKFKNKATDTTHPPIVRASTSKRSFQPSQSELQRREAANAEFRRWCNLPRVRSSLKFEKAKKLGYVEYMKFMKQHANHKKIYKFQ